VTTGGVSSGLRVEGFELEPESEVMMAGQEFVSVARCLSASLARWSCGMIERAFRAGGIIALFELHAGSKVSAWMERLFAHKVTCNIEER
jgi:hypothetical protein